MRDLVDELLQAKVKARLFGGDHAPRLGRLVITDRLGAGAMGTVFVAYDAELDREVAVKIVPASKAVAEEARALAKLAHPNVVAVFDVGELDDAVFIVMELARGISLRAWLAAPRDWRVTADVMAGVAAGLAAAHRAGLVHRDVKPDNIIVGDDRARLVDFGLAASVAPEDAEPARAGTPGYIAPEVLAGDAATPASDQYSFGVTLHEALYGVRPPATDARRGAVPAWLHAIVARALAADPLRRFPSLDALSAALGRPGRRRRNFIAVGALAALAGAGLGVLAYRHHAAPADPCTGAPARLATVWSPDVVDRARASLGPAPWTARTIEGLDSTAAQWATSYRAVCEASRVHGGQSDTLLDLRMHCLDRALDRFGALAAALGSPLDAQARASASAAVADLPSPLLCQSIEDAGDLALPSDPADRARIAEAEHTLARASAAFSLARYTDARKELADAMPTSLPPAVRAAALLLGAAIEARIGQPASARAQLDDALAAAAEAHSAELTERVWAQLLKHELFGGAPRHVIEWAPFARAAAVSAGHEGAEIDGILGEALRDAGQLETARAVIARALASHDHLRGDQRALLEMNAGSVELAVGAPAAAEAAERRGLELARAQLGDGHPELAIYVDKLSAAARARGRVREALALADQSLALRTAAFGPEDRAVATSLLGRARALLEADRLDEAGRDAERARAIREAAFGTASPRLGEVLVVQGDIAAAAGNRDAAALLYRTAGERDPRLELSARKAAVSDAYDTPPETLEPLSVDRAAGFALHLTRLSHDAARPLARAALDRVLAFPAPVDPALALPLGEAMFLVGETAGAMAIARMVLGQLAPEPSRSRARAQRLLDSASS